MDAFEDIEHLESSVFQKSSLVVIILEAFLNWGYIMDNPGRLSLAWLRTSSLKPLLSWRKKEPRLWDSLFLCPIPWPISIIQSWPAALWTGCWNQGKVGHLARLYQSFKVLVLIIVQTRSRTILPWLVREFVRCMKKFLRLWQGLGQAEIFTGRFMLAPSRCSSHKSDS